MGGRTGKALFNQIESELKYYKNIEVKWQERLVGRFSKTLFTVDILMRRISRFPQDSISLVIECSRVDQELTIEDLNRLFGKVVQAGAVRGIILNRREVPEPIQEILREHRIIQVVDPEESIVEEWFPDKIIELEPIMRLAREVKRCRKEVDLERKGRHMLLQNLIKNLGTRLGYSSDLEYPVVYQRGNGRIDVVWEKGASLEAAIEIDFFSKAKSIQKLLISEAKHKVWVYLGVTSPMEDLNRFDPEKRIHLVRIAPVYLWKAYLKHKREWERRKRRKWAAKKHGTKGLS